MPDCRSTVSPVALIAALAIAGCNPALSLVEKPLASPGPGTTAGQSVFTGPTPPPLSACEKPSAYGDLIPDPWLRAKLRGQVTDTAGAAVPGATIQARITRLGDQQELGKAIPPTTRSWNRQPDGTWTCSQVHVLVIGDFTKFANGSDSTTTTVGPTGSWELSGAPAGATLELTVAKDGYTPLIRTAVAQPNPDNKAELNRLDLVLSRL